MEARIDSKKRHRSSTEVGIMLDATHDRVANKDSDESSLGSDPTDREEIRIRARKKLKSNPKYLEALKLVSRVEREAGREAQQEIAEEKKKKALISLDQVITDLIVDNMRK